MTDQQAHEKLLSVVREAIKQDDALRSQHQMGEKFKFIRAELDKLIANLEGAFSIKQEQSEHDVKVNESSEELVEIYIYLFNTTGLDMATWRKLVSPDVFYEYSVSRPIYKDKEHVEKFISSRPTPAQHAYITALVPKSAVLPPPESRPEDAIGNPLVKIEEGKLNIRQVQYFKHDNIEYHVSASGELSKKS